MFSKFMGKICSHHDLKFLTKIVKKSITAVSNQTLIEGFF